MKYFVAGFLPIFWKHPTSPPLRNDVGASRFWKKQKGEKLRKDFKKKSFEKKKINTSDMYNIASRLVQYFDSPRARPYPLSLFLPLLAIVPVPTRSCPSVQPYHCHEVSPPSERICMFLPFFCCVSFPPDVEIKPGSFLVSVFLYFTIICSL